MRAFWLDPDWSGGDNLRDPGTVPFWVKPPLRLAVGGGRHIPLLRKGQPEPAAPWGDRPVPLGYGTNRLAPGPFMRPAEPRGPGAYHRVPGRYIEHGVPAPDHTCGPFVRLWTGYEYCKECEKPRK